MKSFKKSEVGDPSLIKPEAGVPNVLVTKQINSVYYWFILFIQEHKVALIMIKLNLWFWHLLYKRLTYTHERFKFDIP
jgi:hypothetical protein